MFVDLSGFEMYGRPNAAKSTTPERIMPSAVSFVSPTLAMIGPSNPLRIAHGIGGDRLGLAVKAKAMTIHNVQVGQSVLVHQLRGHVREQFVVVLRTHVTVCSVWRQTHSHLIV